MSKRSQLGFILATIFLGWIIYWPSFQAPFYFDDFRMIVENPILLRLDHLEEIWRLDPSRAFTHLTFAWNLRYGGSGVFGFHAVNFLLHAVVTLNVYFFIKILIACDEQVGSENDFYRAFLPLISSAIFFCHPIQTSAVTYIVQRSSILMALTYLTAINCYLVSRVRGRNWLYYCAVGCFALGLFTKPNIITLPLGILLCEFIFLKRFPIRRESILRIGVFFVMALAVPLLLSLWKYQSFSVRVLVMSETESIARRDYFLTQLNVIMTYMRLLVIPVGQNLDYDFPVAKTLFSVPTMMSFAGLTVLMATACMILKKHRLLAFSIFWFLLTLSVTSSVFPLADVIFEHRLYLPMVGFALALPVAARQVLTNERVWRTSLVLIVAAYAVLAFDRNLLWRDPVAFLSDVVRKSPHKPRAHISLAATYLSVREYQLAIYSLNSAISLNPNDPIAWGDRAIAKFILGDQEGALRDYNQALILDPSNVEVYNNRGKLYESLQLDDLALDDYSKAIKLNPVYRLAYISRGRLYHKKGEYELAVHDFTTAIAISPLQSDGYFLRFLSYRKEGKNSIAVKDALKAQEFGWEFSESDRGWVDENLKNVQ